MGKSATGLWRRCVAEYPRIFYPLLRAGFENALKENFVGQICYRRWRNVGGDFAFLLMDLSFLLVMGQTSNLRILRFLVQKRRDMRQVKIVATIGPSTCSSEKLEALLDAGINVARFNLSHGTSDWHRTTIQHLRQLSLKKQTSLAILVDLAGP